MLAREAAILAGNWFKSSAENNETHRRWLQKLDVAGALVWEVDRGLPPPESGIDVMAITVAPGGAVLRTDTDYVLYEFDAAGAPLWSIAPVQYIRPAARGVG